MHQERPRAERQFSFKPQSRNKVEAITVHQLRTDPICLQFLEVQVVLTNDYRTRGRLGLRLCAGGAPANAHGGAEQASTQGKFLHVEVPELARDARVAIPFRLVKKKKNRRDDLQASPVPRSLSSNWHLGKSAFRLPESRLMQTPDARVLTRPDSEPIPYRTSVGPTSQPITRRRLIILCILAGQCLEVGAAWEVTRLCERPLGQGQWLIGSPVPRFPASLP